MKNPVISLELINHWVNVCNNYKLNLMSDCHLEEQRTNFKGLTTLKIK